MRCELLVPPAQDLCPCCRAELEGVSLLHGGPDLLGAFLRRWLTRADGSWMLRRRRR